MRRPTSRIRPALLLIFLMAMGLSMTSGACGDDGTVETQVIDSPTHTPRANVPVTPPTKPPGGSNEMPTRPAALPPPASATAAPMPASGAATPVIVAPTVVTKQGQEYLADEIPPCTPIGGSNRDPCDVDTNWMAAVTGERGFGADWGEQPQTIRQHMDGRSIKLIPHIVVRGTYIPETARCVSAIPLRIPSYGDPDYYVSIESTRLIQCYADVRANAYILGSGPPQLTVLAATSRYFEGSFDAEAAAARTGRNVEEIMTEEELVDRIRRIQETILVDGYSPISSSPARDGEGIYGREYLLFIGPGHYHPAEVWEVFLTWAVQRQDDGTVIAVHPNRNFWRANRPDEYQTHRGALEMDLPTFTEAVNTAHQSRVTQYGGRIASDGIEGRADGIELPMLITDANRLAQFYLDTGAYEHPDGRPTQPPPVPACAQGDAVRNKAANRALLRDCIALLDARDALAGTATLNWSADIAIDSWTGIAVSGTPKRVTGINLASSGLSGSIPYRLEILWALTALDLSGNSLTGTIPASLGQLPNLTTVKLSGNSISGCIPAAFRDVTTNDLASVGLHYCDMLTASPASRE